MVVTWANAGAAGGIDGGVLHQGGHLLLLVYTVIVYLSTMGFIIVHHHLGECFLNHRTSKSQLKWHLLGQQPPKMNMDTKNRALRKYISFRIWLSWVFHGGYT